MNAYQEMRQRHQSEFNLFPIRFAFSDKQFETGMRELGLEPSDTDKVYKLGGNGFYRKTDGAVLKEMFDRHDKEMKDAIASDKTGEGFARDMFYYELGNHEYTYTMSVSQTLEALDLTREEVNQNPILLKALNAACKEQIDRYNQRN